MEEHGFMLHLFHGLKNETGFKNRIESKLPKNSENLLKIGRDEKISKNGRLQR